MVGSRKIVLLEDRTIHLMVVGCCQSIKQCKSINCYKAKGQSHDIRTLKTKKSRSMVDQGSFQTHG